MSIELTNKSNQSENQHQLTPPRSESSKGNHPLFSQEQTRESARDEDMEDEDIIAKIRRRCG